MESPPARRFRSRPAAEVAKFGRPMGIERSRKMRRYTFDGLRPMDCLIRAEKSAIVSKRRGGRVAEGGGLLNRYTVQSRIKGSNPFLSAIDT
jgi:hypothetical protein